MKKWRRKDFFKKIPNVVSWLIIVQSLWNDNAITLRKIKSPLKTNTKNTNRRKKIKTLYDQIKKACWKKERKQDFIEPISSIRIPVKSIASYDCALVQYDRDGDEYFKALSGE